VKQHKKKMQQLKEKEEELYQMFKSEMEDEQIGRKSNKSVSSYSSSLSSENTKPRRRNATYTFDEDY
jgi:uncharacterized protein (UPF0147 family)